MKKLLLAILPLLAARYTNAQTWQPLNGNLYNTSGYVGIGTSTPWQPLTVFQPNNANSYISVMNNTINTFFGAGGTSWGIVGTVSNHDFAIYTGNTEKMRIANSGYVGIGTSSPNNPLEVGMTSTAGGDVLRLTSPVSYADNINGILFARNATDYFGRVAGVAETGGRGLAFYINPAASTAIKEAVRISKDGYLGIGTPSPTMPLDVTGNMVLRNSTNATGGGASLFFTSYGDNMSPGARIRSSLIFAQGTYSVSKLILSSYNAGGYPDELTLYGGQVGIGTAIPDAKLEVVGTIHASEVLVDQNVPTPDYVFDKDYDLTSLKDIKTYIDKNHHLPEIPSAAQVAKEGINLGEMNAKLLKKIEELTLYLIEKDKELSKEMLKNELQEKQLNKINKRLHIN